MNNTGFLLFSIYSFYLTSVIGCCVSASSLIANNFSASISCRMIYLWQNYCTGLFETCKFYYSWTPMISKTSDLFKIYADQYIWSFLKYHIEFLISWLETHFKLFYSRRNLEFILFISLQICDFASQLNIYFHWYVFLSSHLFFV